MKRMAGWIVGLALAGTLSWAEEAAVEPIKIGALFAETGPAAFLGAPEAKTTRMLAEKINAGGGILGRPVEFIIMDTEGSPEKAVSFAKKLIEEDNVLAIIGPSTSGETLQIKDLCESEGVLLISCAAAEAIVNPQAGHVFKTPQKDSQAVAWIFQTMKAKGITKIGVLSSNTGFGKGGKAQLEKMAPDYGIEIVANEVYDKEATDLTDVLNKLKTAGGEAVVNWSIEPAQSIVPKNMKQIGMDMPLFQSHGFGNIKYAEQAGEAGEGIIFPCGRLLVVDVLPADHPQKAVLEGYKQDYEQKFNEPVSTFGGHAYDAILIVTEAIKKANSTDPAQVRDAVESITGLVGTAGVFNFSATDHNGLGMDAFEMLTVKDGKFTLYNQ